MKNKIKKGLTGLVMMGALATSNYDFAHAQEKNEDFARVLYSSTVDFIMDTWNFEKNNINKNISFYQDKLEENKGDEMKELKYGLTIGLYELHKQKLDNLICKPYTCSSLEEDSTPLVDYFIRKYERKIE